MIKVEFGLLGGILKKLGFCENPGSCKKPGWQKTRFLQDRGVVRNRVFAKNSVSDVF
jgi:hypothetical protein